MQDFKASSVFLWHQVNAKLKVGSKILQHTCIHKIHRDSSSNKHLFSCSLDLVAEWKCCLLYWDLQYIYTQSQVFRFSKSLLFNLTIISSSFMFCWFTLMHDVFQQSCFCTYSCCRKWRALGKSAGGLLLASRNHEAYLFCFIMSSSTNRWVQTSVRSDHQNETLKLRSDSKLRSKWRFFMVSCP